MQVSTLFCPVGWGQKLRLPITPLTNKYLMQVWGGGGMKKFNISIDCLTSLVADFNQLNGICLWVSII